jgi:phosphoglycolate phosphatase
LFRNHFRTIVDWGLPSLFLFDIDGTLVRRAGPHHRQALVHAVHQVTGLETTTEGIPVHGMLDPDILTQMLLAANFTPARIAFALPPIMEAAQDFYERAAPADQVDLRDKRCPGVEKLLDHLQGRGTILALVTGNLTRIGWKKLERAGLHIHPRRTGPPCH